MKLNEPRSQVTIPAVDTEPALPSPDIPFSSNFNGTLSFVTYVVVIHLVTYYLAPATIMDLPICTTLLYLFNPTY